MGFGTARLSDAQVVDLASFGLTSVLMGRLTSSQGVLFSSLDLGPRVTNYRVPVCKVCFRALCFVIFHSELALSCDGFLKRVVCFVCLSSCSVRRPVSRMKFGSTCQAFLGISGLGYTVVALDATDVILDGGAC